MELAAERGLKLANPELQQPLERAREQIKQARISAQKKIAEPAKNKNVVTNKLPDKTKINKTVTPKKYTDEQTMKNAATDEVLRQMGLGKNVTPKNNV